MCDAQAGVEMLNTRLTAVPMEHMEVSLTGDKTTRHLRTITAKVKVMLASLEEARKSAASKADASMYGGADSGSGGSADELDDGGSLDARQVTFAAAEHPPTAETHSNNSNNNTGEARPGRSSKSSATRGATRPGASTKRWGTQRRGHQPTGASSASKVSRVRVCVCVCVRARVPSCIVAGSSPHRACHTGIELPQQQEKPQSRLSLDGTAEQHPRWATHRVHGHAVGYFTRYGGSWWLSALPPCVLTRCVLLRAV